MNFQPGLVGGHRIGVDPYHLTFAQKRQATILKSFLPAAVSMTTWAGV
jgi:UDP-N-acetyl-D-mannosaminuronate dehydrogenase